MAISQKELGLGLLIGLALPPLALYAVLRMHPAFAGIQRIDHAVVSELNLQLLTLGLLLNAALFFLALKRHWESLARGVLLASLLWLLGVFIYRFLL